MRPSIHELARKKYVEGQTQRELAQEYDQKVSTVASWLRLGHIIDRCECGAFNCPGRDKLYAEYVEKKRSTAEIASDIGVVDNSVNGWLRAHNIELRPKAPIVDERLDDEDWLHKKYIVDDLTQTEISEIADCAPGTVKNRLRDHAIYKH